MSSDPDARELDRRIDVSGLEAADIIDMKVEAAGDECAAIAARLGVLAVRSFEADLHAVRETSGNIALYGELSADVDQACVVSLEPVAQAVKTAISQRFTANAIEEEEAEDEDPLEPIVDDEIDVGEVLVQNLALSLDPYPRAADAVFEPVDDEASQPSGPFAALAQLRDGDANSEK